MASRKGMQVLPVSLSPFCPLFSCPSSPPIQRVLLPFLYPHHCEDLFISMLTEALSSPPRGAPEAVPDWSYSDSQNTLGSCPLLPQPTAYAGVSVGHRWAWVAG